MPFTEHGWTRPGERLELPDDDTLRALPTSDLIRLLGNGLALYCFDSGREQRERTDHAQLVIAQELDRRIPVYASRSACSPPPDLVAQIDDPAARAVLRDWYERHGFEAAPSETL